MVRNLMISKPAPFLPVRTWRKSAGPGEVSFIAMAVMTITGNAAINNGAEQKTSNTRLRDDKNHELTLLEGGFVVL
jgi:hypothetical protein